MKPVWPFPIFAFAVSISDHSALSTSAKVFFILEPRGHSKSKLLLRSSRVSQSPSRAQAWTILPPGCLMGVRAKKSPLSIAPVSSQNSRIAAADASSPPLGSLHSVLASLEKKNMIRTERQGTAMFRAIYEVLGTPRKSARSINGAVHDSHAPFA